MPLRITFLSRNKVCNDNNDPKLQLYTSSDRRRKASSWWSRFPADIVLHTRCHLPASHITSHTWAQSRSRLNWWNLRPMRGAQWMPVMAGRATSSRLPARVVHWRLRTLGGWHKPGLWGKYKGKEETQGNMKHMKQSRPGVCLPRLWRLTMSLVDVSRGPLCHAVSQVASLGVSAPDWLVPTGAQTRPRSRAAHSDSEHLPPPAPRPQPA